VKEMVKHGESGLGYEIIKAVNQGEIIEPLTYQKIKRYCKDYGIPASDNHIRVILPNASENNHSPNYKKYFERIGKGEYRILPEYRRPTKYFWLNVDSQGYEWSFSDIKIGRSQSYSNINPNGSKRKNESCFKSIQIGDMVLAYETGLNKAITTICQVANKYEENEEIIVEFQKKKDFNIYLNLDSLRAMNQLNNCQVIQNHIGTLFELEGKHFDVIVRELNRLNAIESYHEVLYMSVQESLAIGPQIRKGRLENRSTTIPDSYEIITRIYHRNPDVIATVLERANGECEKCNKPAPFIRATNGTPYLEVHHKIRLADGGEDTIENAIAVCPNCHRLLHYG
jgi:predicted HNH restriction endonuclease